MHEMRVDSPERLNAAASSRPLRILLLSHVRPGHANTSHDHERALLEFSRHFVHVHSPVENPDWLPGLHHFDVVVIHYSIVCFVEGYLPALVIRALQDFRGLKVIFIQDEYRAVYAAIDVMERLGVDLLFTCVPEQAVEKLYGELRRRGVRIEPTLTGYVPDELSRAPRSPLPGRPYDIVYRGRPLSPALGRLAQEKTQIARQIMPLATRFNLTTDIDWREDARIYGADWTRFMSSGRAALGTESGASIVDFTGDIERVVALYTKEHPGADYEEVEKAILGPYEVSVYHKHDFP